MQCGDLDRHLEAFLDGHLERGGSGVLRRHLAHCGACRARVERLRQFERDTQRRFRALERAGSVWQGLEFDLVATTRAPAVSRLLALPRALPPSPRGGSPNRSALGRRVPGHPTLAARANGRGQTSRVVGIMLVAMAMSALYQLGRAHLQPADDLAVAAAAYRRFLQDGHEPALRSADAGQLEAWLSAELGLTVPVPRAPDGYRLVGADRAGFAAGEAGVVVYGGVGGESATPVLLFVRPSAAATDATSSTPAGEAGDLHEVAWQSASIRYTLVGREPAEALRQFVD
jgi:anti-sigma factor RsiW